MKKFFILVFVFLFSFHFLFADEGLNIDVEVDVPQSCDVVDTDGVSHTYTATSSDSYLGICALGALIDKGDVSSVGLSNQYPEMGLFVTSFNEKEADPNSQYWALYKNGGYASSGITTLPIVTDDVISFKLSDFSDTFLGDYVNIKVHSLIQNNNSNNSSGHSSGSSYNENTTYVEKAVDFLSNEFFDQKSFGGDLYMDWVAIGISKIEYAKDLAKQISKIIKNNSFVPSSVLDSERHAMALMSLGISPYDGTSVNYIENIVLAFDGFQIGNKDEVNDDIFGLLVLSRAGYNADDEIIKKTIDFIISKQKDNGSFGSVDMTSAAIMSLYKFKKISLVDISLSKAADYIIENQETNGGFGNIYSTSWAVQALSSFDYYGNFTIKAIDYIKSLQDVDGSFSADDSNSKIWSTAYSIPAIYELSWRDIIDKFPKGEIKIYDSNLDDDKKLLEDKPDYKKVEFSNKVDKKVSKTIDYNINNNTIPISKNNVNLGEQSSNPTSSVWSRFFNNFLAFLFN